MRFLLLLLFCSSLICSAQENAKAQEYTVAVCDYIKALRQQGKFKFDTLFIGKQEEFPNISLPAKLENTVILIMPFEEVEKKYRTRNSIQFVNIVSTYSKTDVEFLLIGFKTEKTPKKMIWWPLHNCSIYYTYAKPKKNLVLKKIKFDYSYNNKFTN